MRVQFYLRSIKIERVTAGKSARQVYMSEKFFKENILKNSLGNSLRITMKQINFQFFYSEEIFGLTFFRNFPF